MLGKGLGRQINSSSIKKGAAKMSTLYDCKGSNISSLIHKLQQALLFPLTSQSSIRNNMPLGVQALCSGRSHWKISLNVCKLDRWRSEVVPLIGWCWKKYVVCELVRKRCLCTALTQLHTIHNSSWVTVNPGSLLF